MKTVYLDNAATTPLREEALDALLPFLRGDFANPSSPHSSGQRVRSALYKARTRTAKALGASPREIIFTGSGSEADNLAIFGIMDANGIERFITSAIEHHAVLHAAQTLHARGKNITIVPVDQEGLVKKEALHDALAGKPVALVSIMHANNEIGTIQRIAELSKLAHEHGALIH